MTTAIITGRITAKTNVVPEPSGVGKRGAQAASAMSTAISSAID
ncbi:hypothetical protein PFZ49_08425 [Microbacterium lacticum]